MRRVGLLRKVAGRDPVSEVDMVLAVYTKMARDRCGHQVVFKQIKHRKLARRVWKNCRALETSINDYLTAQFDQLPSSWLINNVGLNYPPLNICVSTSAMARWGTWNKAKKSKTDNRGKWQLMATAIRNGRALSGRLGVNELLLSMINGTVSTWWLAYEMLGRPEMVRALASDLSETHNETYDEVITRKKQLADGGREEVDKWLRSRKVGRPGRSES